MSSIRLKVLLDSTYLLPSFGVEIDGLSDRDITRLRNAAIKGEIKLYCLTTVWVEVIGKVCREAERSRIDLGGLLDVAVRALLESRFYEWITPTLGTIKLAFKLRILGHKDNIDNLLYAASIKEGMILLTMDEDLKRFLSSHGYKTENLMDHLQLLKKIEA